MGKIAVLGLVLMVAACGRCGSTERSTQTARAAEVSEAPALAQAQAPLPIQLPNPLPALDIDTEVPDAGLPDAGTDAGVVDGDAGIDDDDADAGLDGDAGVVDAGREPADQERASTVDPVDAYQPLATRAARSARRVLLESDDLSPQARDVRLAWDGAGLVLEGEVASERERSVVQDRIEEELGAGVPISNNLVVRDRGATLP